VVDISCEESAEIIITSAGRIVEGDVFAADSRTGNELWRYQVGSPLYAAPSTYMIGTRQYVIVPAGTTLTAFALPQR
jgi:outer membrane protein assembly factor BamB